MNLHLHGNHKTCAVCKGTGNGRRILSKGEFEYADGTTWPKEDFFARCERCLGSGREIKDSNYD